MKELERAKEAAEAASASKSRLLAITGHDLKQPLQAIVMCLDFLGQRLSAREDRRRVASAQRSAQKLARAFDWLLEVARLEAGSLQPRIETVNLGRLLEEIVDEHRPYAEEKGVSLRLVTTRLRVRSDRNLLSHIIQNLVSNAIKYTERGCVLIGCRRRTGEVSIQVHDTGIGIAPDQLTTIFDEYRRLDPTGGDGAGLGLFIVKRMANLLGHHLVVRSRPNQGSVFAVEARLLASER